MLKEGWLGGGCKDGTVEPGRGEVDGNSKGKSRPSNQGKKQGVTAKDNLLPPGRNDF